jgi:long-chain acyl-CoA synthetase
VPSEPAAKALAAANGILCNEGLKELILNEHFRNVALKEVQVAGKKGGLNGIEIVCGVALIGDEWTPQNGLVTSAMKLCRRPIVEMYKGEIEAAYAWNS